MRDKNQSNKAHEERDISLTLAKAIAFGAIWIKQAPCLSWFESTLKGLSLTSQGAKFQAFEGCKVKVRKAVIGFTPECPRTSYGFFIFFGTREASLTGGMKLWH